MADATDTTAIAGWVQAGGVLAFAGAVLWELRQIRPIMVKVREVLVALLERERMRAEQRAQLIEMRRRGDSDPPQQRRPPHEIFDDTTDAVSLPPQPPQPPQPPKKRHRTNPRGEPVGVWGPIKPPRDDED